MKLTFKLTLHDCTACKSCVFFVLNMPDSRDLWGEQFDSFGKCVNAKNTHDNYFTTKYYTCPWYSSIGKKL